MSFKPFRFLRSSSISLLSINAGMWHKVNQALKYLQRAFSVLTRCIYNMSRKVHSVFFNIVGHELFIHQLHQLANGHAICITDTALK